MITGVADSDRKRLLVPPIRPVVFVVDDDISVRESLAGLVQYAGWRAETFSSAEEFLLRPPFHAPSCLLLDISLPKLNGLDLQQRIALDRVDMPIIFITGHTDVPMAVRAMKAGAVEFLTKPLRQELLVAAIENALARSASLIDEVEALAAERIRYEALSGRERQVMALVTSGKMNKQIAGELGISEITVKAHRGRVMRKMGVRSLADLVRIASSLGVTSRKNGTT